MRFAVSVVLLGVLSACQSLPDPEKVAAIRLNIEAPTYTPPPRNIDDITAVLAQNRQSGQRLSKLNRNATQIIDPALPPMQQYERYYQRGNAQGALGHFEACRADLLEAARIAESQGQWEQQIAALDDYAQVLQNPDPLAALGLYEDIFRIIDLHSDPAKSGRDKAGWRIRMGMHPVMIYARLGQRQQAEASFARLRQAYQDYNGQRPGKANGRVGSEKQNKDAQFNRAEGEYRLGIGEYAAAERALYEAVYRRQEAQRELGREKEDITRRTQPALNAALIRDARALTVALQQQGKLVEAESVARDNLKRALEQWGRLHPGTASVIVTLSAVLFEQGRYAEAERLARASLESWGSDTEEVATDLAATHRLIGACLALQGRLPEAQASFVQSQQYQVSGMGRLTQGVLVNVELWPFVTALQQQQAGAIKPALEQLLRQRSQLLGSEHAATLEVAALLAWAEAETGHPDMARTQFDSIWPKLAGLPSPGKPGEQLRIRLGEAYLHLLQGEAGRDDRAFQLTERLRGGVVQQAIAASALRAGANDPRLAEDLRLKQDLDEKTRAITLNLQDLLPRQNDPRYQAVLASQKQLLLQLQAQQQDLDQQLRAASPAYDRLRRGELPTLAETRTALHHDEALLGYYVGPQATEIWLVKPDGTVRHARAELPAETIRQWAQVVRHSVEAPAGGPAQFPAFAAGPAQQLYLNLVAPVARQLVGVKQLVVVPHGPLASLPFSLLLTDSPPESRDRSLMFDRYRDYPWLMRQYAVSQLPSVGSLTALRAAPPSRAQLAYAGFGDPLFSPADREAAAVASPNLTRAVVRNLKVSAVPVAHASSADTPGEGATVPPPANSAGLAQLNRLPDTAQEVSEIARVLGADPARDLYLGLQASVDTLRQGRWDNRRTLVFATHGLIPGDLDGLNQPALALTNPSLYGGQGDGLLKLDDVLQLRLDADWVVLSACNTAGSDGRGGEAVSGLGRGFFYAGARALLVTNWPVESTSARLLTTSLFARQAAQPTETRAESLRQTMLALLDREVYREGNEALFSYAHPLFWAPYSLVGDGGTR